MRIIKDKISVSELQNIAKKSFGNLVKAVVDTEKEIMAIDGELHADEETLLLEKGSKQKNLWGINIYPDKKSGFLIEFDSMINLRPSEGNLSRSIDNSKIQAKIKKIVNQLIAK